MNRQTGSRNAKVLGAAVVAIALTACQDRERPTVVDPPPAPRATESPASGTGSPPIPPSTGADVDEKGTQTGMIGGASGTVGSGGKPGSGTVAGAGTGPALSSGERIENKK